MSRINIVGDRFGRLVVKEKAESIRSPSRLHTAWLCVCDCGTEISVKTNGLRTGNTRSCGCLKSDVQSARAGKRTKNMIEYNTWSRIKGRCYNKNNQDYESYGGRGIGVCDRWLESFDNFLSDMGERPSDLHSIDRIDNNGSYSPENCRWATNHQQSRNKRNNVVISFRGREMILQDWADEIGISWVTLYERIQKHSLEKALTSKKGEI